MPLSFFRALNPSAKTSGIIYRPQGYNGRCQEIIDQTVSEHITEVWAKNLSLYEGLNETFGILYGRHYDTWYTDNNAAGVCAKGVLDYLIFPLLARKIRFFDDELNDQELFVYHVASFINWQSLLIFFVLPMEIVRFSAALALTLVLAPVVALVTAFRGCFSNLKVNPKVLRRLLDETSDLPDIPEGLCCPLSTQIFHQPIKLPTCNILVEKSFILKWVSKQGTCPFSRLPLSEEAILQLKPNVEKQKQVEDFLHQHESKVYFKKLQQLQYAEEEQPSSALAL